MSTRLCRDVASNRLKTRINIENQGDATLDEMKGTSIRAYPERMNVRPARDYGRYDMYRCPYGEDRNASFKVDYARNPWYDFGTGEGGSVVDPVARLHGCSFGEAVGKLAERDVPANERSDDSSTGRFGMPDIRISTISRGENLPRT